MYKTLYITSDSAFVDVGSTNENFTITKYADYTSYPKEVKLITANIPYTWFNITADNNTFTVTEDGIGPVLLTIPAGNYSALQLQTELQIIMNAGLTQVYTVTYNASYLTYTFSTAGVAGIQFTFAEPSAALLLGFDPGSTYPAAPATTVTSVNGILLLPDYEIYVCSDLVEGVDNGVIPMNINNVPTLTNQSQILAVVPISGFFSAVINYSAHPDIPYYPISQSYFAKNKSSNDTSIPSVRFFLAFPSGAAVDLNGYKWTATLVLRF